VNKMEESIRKIVEKLKGYEEAMAREKGPFNLFGLFLRDDAPEKWDILLAADWIQKNKEESFKYIADTVQSGLSKEEMLKLSRIVLISETNPALEAMYKAIGGGRDIEVSDSNFFGLQIKHAYFIALRRRGSKR
jgi:hypothetical protein